VGSLSRVFWEIEFETEVVDVWVEEAVEEFLDLPS
jgi:hypothetical protein